MTKMGFPSNSAGKESACNARDAFLISGSGSSPGERTGYLLKYSWASLVAQMVKNPPAMKKTQIWSMGCEDPLEDSMATHSSILAWRIPWTEEPGGLQSMGSQRVRQDWATKYRAHNRLGVYCLWQNTNSSTRAMTLINFTSQYLQSSITRFNPKLSYDFWKLPPTN